MKEILIKISDDDYEWMKMGSVSNQGMKRLYQAIKNGTPLPEHHGRLIDADAIPRYLVRDIDEIDKQPTIIEGSENECQIRNLNMFPVRK